MARAYSRSNILSRLFNQPLAVMPQTAAIVLGAVGERLDVSQLFVATDGQALALGDLEQLAATERQSIKARGGIDRRAKMYPAEKLMMVHNGVAHVAVRGETVAENGTIGPESGFTGYDGIIAAVQAADADPAVSGILLDIDSPGGEVAGLFECAAILMMRRGTKPMRAMIRGCGCSAAYALAACADQITLHELGVAGSIGTVTMHADFSKKLESDGIKVTLFTAGDHKADGNPFGPLPAEVAAEIQAMVERANDRFVAHVAQARGLTEAAVRGQQAKVYRGEAALAAGLVDKIMGWQDSMDEFEAAVNGAGNRPAATAPQSQQAAGARSAKGNSMSTEATAPAAENQPEFTQTQLDAAVNDARVAASAEAAAGERARISALVELDAASTVSPELAAAIADGVSAGDFAIGVARAAKLAGPNALAVLASETATVTGIETGAAAASAAQAAPEANRGQAYANKKAAASA